MEFSIIWNILAGTNAFHLSGIGCTCPYKLTHLIVAFALPKRIERGLAVDRWAAVAVRVTSAAQLRVRSALYRVRRLVNDEEIVLNRASLSEIYSEEQ